MNNENRTETASSIHFPHFTVLHTLTHRHIRVVLTNGHIGYVPWAPGFFFLFDGPQLAVVKYFLKLIILLPSQKR